MLRKIAVSFGASHAIAFPDGAPPGYTGGFGGPGEAHWRFRWTVPEEASGAVGFHAAAIAGNDDLSRLGDSVYTLERLLRPR